ncbi:MAG TPA: PfkB family carbohydrate kinase [Lacipirellulaceae bacterium]
MPQSMTIVGLGEALWDMLPGGKQLGGAPLNVACHAHQLLRICGGRGVVASRIGGDDLGHDVVAQLAAREMPTEFVQRDGAHATSTVHVELKDGQPTYRFTPDIAWDHLEFTPQWQQLAARCGAVCFGTLAGRSPQSRRTIWSFLDEAPQAVRLFDVNLRQGFYDRESIVEGCRRATIVKLNEEELPIVARELGPDDGPVELQLRQLLAKFALTAVVYTRGPRGTLLVLTDELIDPAPVKYPAAANADAVGAGDACSAGILVGFLLGWPPARIAALANRLGAFVASQPGATPTLPVEIVGEIG